MKCFIIGSGWKINDTMGKSPALLDDPDRLPACSEAASPLCRAALHAGSCSGIILIVSRLLGEEAR